ncbi:MAG: PDZ domain-containing protein [Pyrinomonadaceae bacterium]
MRTSKILKLLTLAFPVVIVVGLGCLPTAAQTAAPSPAPHRTPTASGPRRVIVQNKPAAPQVVTILHRLNGLQVMSLLASKEQAEVIVNLDQRFDFSGEVHTNVIAGLALDDGKTIVAWLPEAEAELPPPAFFTPRASVPPPLPPKPGGTTEPPSMEAPPVAPVAAIPRVTTITIPGVPSINFQGNLFEPADLRIITRDGRRISGHYIGLDGLTGLSLITLAKESLPVNVDLKEEAVAVGQKIRVIGPQPAPGSESVAGSPMYIRIAETEAFVVDVIRSPSGGLAKVRVRSAKFTPANIGGIAINDNNETLGIVNGVEGGEATIVPLSLVRMAASRVTARQASVPRPWLGIRGEPIGATSLERILRNGWELQRARALAEKAQGIMLTWVAPGSPAALAKLKQGDVILTVNDDFIRNAQEFTFLLDEASQETPVHFTVARPEKEFSEAVEIQLSESPDPFFPYRRIEKEVSKSFRRHSLLGEGIEAVTLRPAPAARLGSTGGLLVLSVRPATDAFKAGLRPGDVIESIDGERVYTRGAVRLLPVKPGVRSSCIVVRNKERINLTFQYSPDEDDEPDKP